MNINLIMRDTEYVLNKNNCSELINDEEKPVKDIDVDQYNRIC